MDDGAGGGESDFVGGEIFGGGDGEGDAVGGEEVFVARHTPGDGGLAGGAGFERELCGDGHGEFKAAAGEEGSALAFCAGFGCEGEDAVLLAEGAVGACQGVPVAALAFALAFGLGAGAALPSR